MAKWSLFLILFLISANVFAEPYVQNIEDFFMHMRNHVDNVRTLADQILELAKKDPEVKKAIGLSADQTITPKLSDMIREFIAIHDSSKIDASKEFLSRYSASRPLIYDLYKVYGKTYVQMTEEEKQIIQKVINGTDAKERDLFMSRFKPTAFEMKVIDAVEKMADGVERGSNPVTSEEMAKKVLLQSEILEKDVSKKAGDELNQLKSKLALSKKLENIYFKITKPLLTFKDEVQSFKTALKSIGISLEYLDEFSAYQLMDDFKKSNPFFDFSNKQLLQNKLQEHFFVNNDSINKIQKMISPRSKEQGEMMIELSKARYSKLIDPTSSNRFIRLLETLEGECVK
jgi:hypothetical protein